MQSTNFRLSAMRAWNNKTILYFLCVSLWDYIMKYNLLYYKILHLF